MTLRQEMFDSTIDNPRNLHELMRNIALFVPDDHMLAASVKKCLSSMSFAPPENMMLYFMRFMSDVHVCFPTEQSILYGPTWIRVVSILVSCDPKCKLVV